MKGFRFLFTSNALSKRMFCSGLLKVLTGQGKRSIKKSTQLIADYFKVDREQVFLFGAGRMSVYLLLKTLNLKQEDEVLVAGYTCVVLTNSVKFAGCKVNYVDIAPNHVNPSLQQVLDSIGTRTKALIIPHNFGIPFEGIEEIKRQFPDLIIIEDAAHTLGSKTADGKLCGTLGDAAFFSLEYSKPLTTGLGGIMLINNPQLQETFEAAYQKLPSWKGKDVFRMIVTLMGYNLGYARSTRFFSTNSLRILRLMRWQYGTSQQEIDGDLPKNYPVQMSGAQACFLPVQFQKIEEINRRKKEISRVYTEFFASMESVHTIGGLEDMVLVRYPILWKETVSTETIEAVKQAALKEGFNFGVWFNDVVHPAGSFRYCYQPGVCPNGEYLSKRILNLPVNANYPPQKKDLDALQSIFRKFEIH